MSTYLVTDPRTGKKLRLTGDSPPTEEEVNQLFAPKSNVTKGMARSATEGLTLGWGDEIGLGLAAIAKKITDDKPLGQIYDEMREAYNLEQNQFEDEHPYLAGGSKLAGGLSTGIAGGLKMLPNAGSSVAKKLATYGATGAGFGGVTGAGEAEPGERTEGATTGAIVGGVAGVALPAVGMGITAAGKKAASYLPSQAKTIAGRQVASDLSEAGLKKGGASARLNKIGPEATLADISTQTRARAESIAQLPGAGSTASKTYIHRNAGAGQRVADTIEGLNKGKIDLGGHVDDIIEKTKIEASPAYRKVFDHFDVKTNPITTPSNSLTARGPSSKVLANLQDNRLVKKAAESRGVTLNKNKPMGLEEWNSVKQGLDDIGYGKTATNVMGRVEGDVKMARQFSHAIVKELDTLVKKGGAGTAYKDARGIYSGSAKAIEAAEEGSKFWNKSPQQIKRALKSMSKSEQESYRLAALQKLYDDALKTTEGGSVYAKLFNNAANKAKIKAILQDDDSFRAFQKVLRGEREMNISYKDLTQGSQTARKLAGMSEAGIDAAPVADVAQGRPIAAAFQWTMGKLKQLSIPPKQREELAKILMSKGPQAQAELKRIMTEIPLTPDDHRLIASIVANQAGMMSGR